MQSWLCSCAKCICFSRGPRAKRKSTQLLFGTLSLLRYIALTPSLCNVKLMEFAYVIIPPRMACSTQTLLSALCFGLIRQVDQGPHIYIFFHRSYLPSIVSAVVATHCSVHGPHGRCRRWTKGHMQIFFSRRCPLLNWKLPLVHKILYTNGTWA